MDPNPFELFVHVSGVIGLFVGYATLLLGTTALRRTNRVEDARVIARIITAGRQIGFEYISVIDVIVVASVLVLAASGLDMARYTGDWRSGWAQVSIATLVLLAPVGPFVINPRLHAIARATEQAEAGTIPPSLRAQLTHPVLAVTLRASFMTLIALVFLMIVKPPFWWAVIAVLSALVVGLEWAAAEAIRRRVG